LTAPRPNFPDSSYQTGINIHLLNFALFRVTLLSSTEYTVITAAEDQALASFYKARMFIIHIKVIFIVDKQFDK